LERVAGVGAPRPRSPWWLAFLGPFALFTAAYLLRDALAGDWGAQTPGVAGALLLVAWQLTDVAGSLAWLRRGRRWGRTLRALGTIFLMPTAFALYALSFRDGPASPFFAVVSAACAALAAAGCAYRLARELLRGVPRT
jgi:hypothetical protein